MNAAGIILLLLFIIGMAMALYYALLCFPPELYRSKTYYVDPERGPLMDNQIDHNDNSESAPSAPETTADDGTTNKTEPAKEMYPNVPKPNGSLNGDETFASVDTSNNPTRDSGKQSLDTPDCAKQTVRENTIVCSNDNVECKEAPEPSHQVDDKSPLLHGDDEDGLFQCQPSVRSKNTGEPIPAIKESAPHTVIMIPQPLNSTSEEMTPAIEQPSHVAPEIIKAPVYAPSHLVVTMAPQPMSVPPVYDEPPMDEQPVVSLQQHFLPVASNPLVTSNVVATPMLPESDLSHEQAPVSERLYGWKDNISDNNSCGKVDENVQQVEIKNDIVIVADKTKSNEDISVRNEEVEIMSKETYTKRVTIITETTLPSDSSTQSSPRYKSDGAEGGSDTSEPEVCEYSFEASRLVPSTLDVLADEISTISNVKILKYSPIDENVAADASASTSYTIRTHHGDVEESDVSATDSLKVQTGDLERIDDVEESDGGNAGEDEIRIEDDGGNIGESVPDKQKCGGPDLTIPRRSPDGDSMKSNEEERTVSHSVEVSPQKPAILEDCKVTTKTNTEIKSA